MKWKLSSFVVEGSESVAEELVARDDTYCEICLLLLQAIVLVICKRPAECLGRVA
jgi:hypothetical protein